MPRACPVPAGPARAVALVVPLVALRTPRACVDQQRFMKRLRSFPGARLSPGREKTMPLKSATPLTPQAAPRSQIMYAACIPRLGSALRDLLGAGRGNPNTIQGQKNNSRKPVAK